jgi:hypothetical protein
VIEKRIDERSSGTMCVGKGANEKVLEITGFKRRLQKEFSNHMVRRRGNAKRLVKGHVLSRKGDERSLVTV